MGNTEKNDTASTIRILKAAEEIFAAKGFDGARVDEIAKRAGVNKALIYYYFESKEQILEELSKKHLQEILEEKEELLKRMWNPETGFNRDILGKMIETSLWTMLGDRKNFLGIILIEVLKNKSGESSFFSLVNQLYDDTLTRLNNSGYKIDIDEFKTVAFFYGIIPVIFYMTMWEKWAEFNHIDKEKVKKTFIDSLTEIEFSLFLNKFNFIMNKEVIDIMFPDKTPGPE